MSNNLKEARSQLDGQDDMRFFERMYRCHLVLGTKGVPWNHADWTLISDRLTPIVDMCRGSANLRVIQRKENSRDFLKFGKQSLKPEHNIKWTHNPPIDGHDRETWKFYLCEGTAPSYPQSSRDKIQPDFAFSIVNERFLPKAGTSFEHIMFFALAEDMPAECHDLLHKLTVFVADRYDARLQAELTRPWGYSVGSNAFQNSIQELPIFGLFKLGNYHSRPLDKDTFVQPWNIVK